MKTLSLFADGLLIGATFSALVFSIAHLLILFSILLSAGGFYFWKTPQIENPEQRVIFAAGLGIGVAIGVGIIRFLLPL